MAPSTLFYTYAQPDERNGVLYFPGGPFASGRSSETNLLSPFATDLMAGSAGGTEYRVATTGTAPNRVCTIQWKNVRDKPKQRNSTALATIGTQYDNFSFQVKLYETTGQIDFVYGPGVAGPGTDASRMVEIGIKGNTTQAGDVVMVDKEPASPWANAVFRSDYYTGALSGNDPFNIRRSTLADVGRTYRFRASAPTDAVVRIVYSLGQLPVGTPHAVRAIVHNAGTEPLVNLPVTLNVSGSNTFTTTTTLANLAPGASTTVSFAPYTAATRLGTNTLAVSVPTDAFPDTDATTMSQVLTANTFGYLLPPSNAAITGQYGYGAAAGTYAVKYTLPRAATLEAITDFVPRLGNSVGQTIYGVVTDASGTILGSTPPYVVRAADLGTTVTFTFATPVALPAGDFLAGIAQTAATVEHYPVGALFESTPRADAFYGRVGVASGPFTDLSQFEYGPFAIGAVFTNVITGTAKATAGNGFSLAPNPAVGTSQLTLAVPAPAAQPVRVLDALGRTVRQATLPAHATQLPLDLAGLPRGVYVVRVGNAAQRLVLE